MNIVDIYKTKKEDVKLINPEEKDVFTCVYIENSQKNEFQCFGDTETFIDALEDYEKYLKKVELKINKDIEKYFDDILRRRNKIACPFHILAALIFFLICFKPSEILGILFIFSSLGIEFCVLAATLFDMKMNEKNIKKHVTDQNVIKAKEKINKKIDFVKNLIKKYKPQLLSNLKKEKDELEKINKIQQELQKQQKQNIIKEEDFLDYIKLSESDKLKIRKKAESIGDIKRYSGFLPDVPSYLAKSVERDNIRVKNFLEFALADKSLSDKKIDVDAREVDVKKIIDDTYINALKEKLESISADFESSKRGRR